MSLEKKLEEKDLQLERERKAALKEKEEAMEVVCGQRDAVLKQNVDMARVLEDLHAAEAARDRETREMMKKAAAKSLKATAEAVADCERNSALKFRAEAQEFVRKAENDKKQRLNLMSADYDKLITNLRKKHNKAMVENKLNFDACEGRAGSLFRELRDTQADVMAKHEKIKDLERQLKEAKEKNEKEKSDEEDILEEYDEKEKREE